MKSGPAKLLIVFVIAFIAILYAAMVWKSNDNYYVESYRPLIEESNARNAKIEKARKEMHLDEDSNQPQPLGMKESDIKKKDGYRSKSF